MFAHSYGIAGFVIVALLLILDAIAVILIWRSTERTTARKVAWTAAVAFLPALGGIGWLVSCGLGRATTRLAERTARQS